MTHSSVPVNYSNTSSDTITLSNIDLSAITNGITISNIGSTYYTGGFTSTGTISTGPSFTINAGAGIGGLDTSTFVFNTPEEWVDTFPDWNRIQQMCKEYPGLQIAFEKFKTTYKLVKDHYDTPEDKRPKP